MSQERKTRLRRVVDMRTREFERSVQALNTARQTEEQALLTVEQARKKAESALKAQQALALVGTSAVDWADMNNWMLSQQHKADAASERRIAAITPSRGAGSAV